MTTTQAAPITVPAWIGDAMRPISPSLGRLFARLDIRQP
jgi:hypothetical protein